jgi:hypothetical protein
MKHLLTTLFTFCVLVGSGQGFSKRHVDVRPAMQYASVFLKDSAFYTVGVTTQMQAPTYVKPLWSQLSIDGDLKNYRVLNDTDNIDYGTFFNTGQFVNDSVVKLYGYASDGANLYPILWTILCNGTLLKSTIFSDSGSSLIRGDYMLSDLLGNHYLTASYQYAPGALDSYIIKVDKNDSVLWKKRYGSLGVWDEYVTSACLLNTGNVMVGNWKFDQNLPNMKSYTWLFEIDTIGAIVRQWFDSDSTMEASGLKQTKDGGFIYASKKILSQDIGDVYTHSTVIKLDSIFNKQWTWESDLLMGYSIDGIDIEELSNGDFIVCGNGNYLNPNHTLLSAFIMRLRSDGFVAWKNGYTAMDTDGVENFLNDIDVLPDGSYVAVGYTRLPSSVQSTQRQQAWILKVDSNGCVIENCLVGVKNEPQATTEPKHQIKVYPNPATDVVMVDYGFTDWSKGAVTLQLTNALGQVVFTQNLPLYSGFQKLNISPYPAGTYRITLHRSNQTIAKATLVKE